MGVSYQAETRIRGDNATIYFLNEIRMLGQNPDRVGQRSEDNCIQTIAYNNLCCLIRQVYNYNRHVSEPYRAQRIVVVEHNAMYYLARRPCSARASQSLVQLVICYLGVKHAFTTYIYIYIFIYIGICG